jgi:hypothetical protein
MPKKPDPEFKPPPTVGACADLLYTTRQERLVEQRDIAEYEAREKALKEHLIATLPKSDQTGAVGKVARAQIVTETVPAVEDWEKLYKFIKRNNRFDLLNRAVNAAAVREMWDNNKVVPGVGTFTVVKVSVTKL